jgi:predicted RNA-binding protein with RPS1 domain
MILTEETELTLKTEFIKHGRTKLLEMLKNENKLSNIDINSREKVKEYLTLQIAKTTQRPKNINNKNTRKAQIKANIEAFNDFIDNFNNNIEEERDTLKKALTNYGSANLIRVLESFDAAELTSSA